MTPEFIIIVNIDLHHQYGISVTESQTFLLAMSEEKCLPFTGYSQGSHSGVKDFTSVTAAKTSLINWIRLHSHFISITATRLMCQLQVYTPDDEFAKTLSKLRKRKKKMLLSVHILHNVSNQEISRCSHAVTANKCTKKRDSQAELLFCFFNVPVAVAVVTS